MRGLGGLGRRRRRFTDGIGGFHAVRNAKPARFLQALAPFAFGLLLERAGVEVALAVTSGLTFAAFVALLALKVQVRR